MERLGECIRKCRKEAKFKVCELAKRVGVEPEYITQIEKGRRYPSEKLINKIIKTLGFDFRPIYYKEKYADLIIFVKNRPYLLAEIKPSTK